MVRWRWTVAVLLLTLIGLPLAMPLLTVCRVPTAWEALEETDRLALLARNTLLLVGGTLALAAPIGILGAVLLYRTDLPLRRVFRFVLVVSLFIPLPLFASAWQAALGSGGWLPLQIWTTPSPSDPDISSTGIAWKPWAQGLPAAIWIHAVAGLPWIVVLVGQGLCWVERELEEDALLACPPWRVLLGVTLRRSQAAIAAAMLWVALQTATEVTVTDMLQVRTFAEEVYNQFVRPPTNTAVSTILAEAARAVAVSFPGTLAVGLAVWWAAQRWEKRLPSLDRLALRPWTFALGQARLPCLLMAAVLAGVLVGVPVMSLIWKAGLTSNTLSPLEASGDYAFGQYWSARTVMQHVVRVLQVRGGLVLESLWQAAAAGAICAALAWVSCWLATGSRTFRGLTLLLVIAAWSTPGPVIGFGLKETIRVIVLNTRSEFLATALYDGPSPLPVLWADMIRFFPAAVAVLWPVVRLVPSEALQSARVDGASPTQELRRVVWPLTATAFVRAGLAAAILSLGELSAGKLAEPAGSQTFAHEVFVQMHNGVSNDLAALCLVLLAVVLAGGAVVGSLSRIVIKRL